MSQPPLSPADASLTPPRNSTIRVAVVEDDVHFQAAVVAAIGTCDDIQLMGMVSTLAGALVLLQGAPADVLLVDIGLPDGSGVDLIAKARQLWPHCNVMVCTTFGDEAHVMQSIEAGASGYLLKDREPENMLDEIRSLQNGGSPISPLIARQVLMRFRQVATRQVSTPSAERTATLTAREQQVLELITKGFNPEEIGTLLEVSHHTVRTFVRRIYAKLGVSSRGEAIYEARLQGLVRR